MFKFFNNHLVQAVTLSLVGVLIASIFFINPIFSFPFIIFEIVLIWRFNKSLDQRQDVKEIIDNLNQKEKRINGVFLKIIQTRGEIETMAKQVKKAKEQIEETKEEIEGIKSKVFGFFGGSEFNPLEERIDEIENRIDDAESRLRNLKRNLG